MGMNPKFLRPRATGFSPRNLTSLAAWYDPTVSSSYTIATGVSEWRDLSGNGRTLSQGTANNQPTLSTIGSKTALLFDGSNDTLVANSPILANAASGQFTAFIVLQVASTEAGYVFGNNGASSQGFGLYCQTTPDYTMADARQIPRSLSGTRGNNVGEVVSLVYNNSTTTFAINGTVGGTQSGISYGFVAAVDNLVIGNRPDGASAATFFSGRVGSVIFYSRALTETERKRVEKYLGGLYGITVA